MSIDFVERAGRIDFEERTAEGTRRAVDLDSHSWRLVADKQLVVRN